MSNASIIVLITPGKNYGEPTEEFRVQLFEGETPHEESFETICKAFDTAEKFEKLAEMADYANYLSELHKDSSGEHPDLSFLTFKEQYRTTATRHNVHRP